MKTQQSNEVIGLPTDRSPNPTNGQATVNWSPIAESDRDKLQRVVAVLLNVQRALEVDVLCSSTKRGLWKQIDALHLSNSISDAAQH